MKYDLIGIHGLPRAGKDTIANFLVSEHGYLRHGPSVHVKDAAAAMFGVPREYFDDDNIKDRMDPFWKKSYREMAQYVGKECSRDIFGEDFWLRHVERQLIEMRSLNYQHTGMVLADIRYENEVEWVKKNNGIVLFVIRSVNRPKASNEGHAAERGLNPSLADQIVYNNDTIYELYEQVRWKLQL